MCIIELVDYNDTYGKEGKSAGKAKTRRSRGGSKVEKAPVDEATEVKTEAKAQPEAKAKSAETKPAEAKEAKGKKKE
jgi:large subunit ribosomal protein L17